MPQVLKEKHKAEEIDNFYLQNNAKTKTLKKTPKKLGACFLKLMEGFQSNHKAFVPKNFLNKAGVEAKNDADNVKILREHYHNLFNCCAEIDLSVLDNIPEHEVQHHMGNVSTRTEIKKAVWRMANDKAPEKSGLTTDMLKNLPPKAFQLYVNFIQKYWENQDIDYDWNN